MTGESIDLNKLMLKLLNEENRFIHDFDCGENDLNKFLTDDAINYHEQMLAKTYLVLDKITNEVIAYYTVLSDKIVNEAEISNSQWKKFKKAVPHAKRNSDFPAVKIGRLAISEKYAKKGLGCTIIDLIKGIITDSDFKPGCRFLTVDALDKTYVIDFYLKNGFNVLIPDSQLEQYRKKNETVPMVCDLKNNELSPLPTPAL